MNRSNYILRTLIVVVIISSAGLLLGVSAGAQGGGRARRKTEFFNGREVAAGQVLVKFRGPAVEESLAQVRQEADVAAEKRVGRGGARLLHSRSKNTATLLRELSGRPDVVYAEPNYIIRPAAVPNDPSFKDQWGLQNTGSSIGGSAAGTPGVDIGAASAWEVSTGSRAHVVAVIDTGVDSAHPDLAANMWSAPAAFTVEIGGQTIRCEAGTHGFNAITKTCDPSDEYDHGTHVAGIIGAAGNNGVGGAGINWTASIMDVKFIDAGGGGTLSDAIDAIEFVIQARQALGAGADVRVLSNSWGWNGEASQTLLDEINLAAEHGLLFVAGAGNGGEDRAGDDNDNGAARFYPASYDAPNVIAVAATDANDSLASFSNYGATTVDLGAPGVLVFSTIKGGLYDYWGGTSMATPQVSGAAALLLSRCDLDAAALKGTLLNNVDPVASLNGVTATGGRLNVNKAIRACADLTKPANAWPSVELTSPSGGDVFTAPAGVFVSANALDGDGAVQRVDFYAGRQLIGTTSASPHSMTWGNVAAGVYSLTAVAVDDLGATTTSRPVNITVRASTPTPTPTPVPSPTPALVNHALAANGATARASSTLDAGRSAPAVINGDRKGLHWGTDPSTGSGWHDATNNAYPDWLEITFAGERSISEVHVFSVQDSYAAPQEPSAQMTFSKYGVTDFSVEYWNGSAWQAAPGGMFVSNKQVWAKLTFAPLATTKIRVVAVGALAGHSRLTEIEAWGSAAAAPPPPRVNVAAAANGATVSASSTLDAGRAALAAINGDRKAVHWGSDPATGSGWHDATNNVYPDRLEITFAGPKTISEVYVFSVQDNVTAPQEPTAALTFTKYGLQDFHLEYFDGSQWVAVPGAAASNNNLVRRGFTFTPVTTGRLRVVVGRALAGYARIAEVEAY